MSIKSISILVAFSLLVILSSQVYLIYDYYQTTKRSLVRETDTIIKEVFLKDMNERHREYKKIIHEDTITVIPPPPLHAKSNYDSRRLGAYAENVSGAFDLIINTHISKRVPLRLNKIYLWAGQSLKSRKIDSDYVVFLVDPVTSKVLDSAGSKFEKSLFTIPSDRFAIDMTQRKSLQLFLLNPFGVIFQRMGWMLFISIVFSVICLLAFRYLLKVLARQKQLVAFKNEFLGSIAHELKRPVASLTLNLDCLGMPGILNNPKQHEQLLHRSVNATTEMNHTILMIVSLARAEEGLLKLNKSTVQLDAMLEELKAGMESGASKPVQLHLAAVTPDLAVAADEQLLKQCFANLIDNAIKYSGAKVEIDITIRQQDSGVVVAIKDNGLGIPADKLPHIFEKYNRAHAGDKKISGFGIGLNYVKTIVEKHNGRIEVSSEENSGSEFRVWLPA